MPIATKASKTTKAAVARPKAPAKPVTKAKPAPKASAETAPKTAQRKPAGKALGEPVAAARKRRLPKIDADQRQHYVAVAAYYIAERRGFLGGCESEDWAQAEQEIDRLLMEGKLIA